MVLARLAFLQNRTTPLTLTSLTLEILDIGSSSLPILPRATKQTGPLLRPVKVQLVLVH